MMKHVVFAALIVWSLFLVPLREARIPVAAQSATTKSQDPAQLKRTMLERMVRLPPTYRDGTRLKWEWYDGVARSYLFERRAIVEEVSAAHGSLLRNDYVFQGVKVTFQEIFNLTDKDDDKLVPILSFQALLSGARQNVFEGLTLLGKQGETKGTITRKYTASAKDAGGVGNFDFVDVLEYKDPKTGKLEIAGGFSYDAVNLRWRDIKDRVVDDMTDERAAEARALLREAYAKSLKASVPDR